MTDLGRFGAAFMSVTYALKGCLWRHHLVLKQSDNVHFYYVSIFIMCEHHILREKGHCHHELIKIYRVSYAFYVCRALRCEKVVLRETLHNSGSPHWSALCASFNTIKPFPRIQVVTGTGLMTICAVYCFLTKLSTFIYIYPDSW